MELKPLSHSMNRIEKRLPWQSFVPCPANQQQAIAVQPPKFFTKKKVIKHLLISIFSGFYVLSSVYLLSLCRTDFPEQSSPKISFLVVIPFVCEASTDQDILFIL